MAQQIERKKITSFSVKDLDKRSWKDFERFFARYNGVQAGCWCMYYHRKHQTPGNSLAEKTENNHNDKKDLVWNNKSRGILIYADGNPVGWGQFGTREELPRIDNGRIYKKLEPPPGDKTLWRITCFFVDREHRRRSVATLALREILKRIEKLGGGIIEAYPVTTFKTVSTWFGTVSMFEKQGFKIVSELGKSNVLVRKVI